MTGPMWIFFIIVAIIGITLLIKKGNSTLTRLVIIFLVLAGASYWFYLKYYKVSTTHQVKKVEVPYGTEAYEITLDDKGWIDTGLWAGPERRIVVHSKEGHVQPFTLQIGATSVNAVLKGGAFFAHIDTTNNVDLGARPDVQFVET
jgi:hypothetical protein